MVRGTGTAGIRAAAAAASRNVKTESPEEPDISDENDYDEEDEDDDQTHGIASVAGGPRRASVAGNGSSSSARGPMEIRDGKKFRCSLCSETFGRVYELRRHQAIHTDNRAFVCDKCGSGFARKDALIRHVRSSQGQCERRSNKGGRKSRIVKAREAAKANDNQNDYMSPSASSPTPDPPLPVTGAAHSIHALSMSAQGSYPVGRYEPVERYEPVADLRPPSATFTDHVKVQEIDGGYVKTTYGATDYAYNNNGYSYPSNAYSQKYYDYSHGSAGTPGGDSSGYSQTGSLFQTSTGQFRVPLDPSSASVGSLPPLSAGGSSGSAQNLLPYNDHQSHHQHHQPQHPSLAPISAYPPLLAKDETPAPYVSQGPFELLPIPHDLEHLLDLYAENGWIHHPILHLPTMIHRLYLLCNTSQTLEDYQSLGLCPVTMQAVMWTAVRLAEDQQRVELWGKVCWDNLTAWSQRLGLDPGGDPSQADPDDLYAFVRAGVVAGNVAIALGRVSDALKLRETCIRAHRASKFGTNPKDACISDGVGGWTCRRDPGDLAGWIAAEERARTSAWLILWDSTASDVQGTRVTFVSGGYVLRGGEIKCAERTGELGDEHLEPGHYFNASIPCPDYLFEQLPPAPTNQYEREEWLRRDAAQGGIIRWVPVPYGEVNGWMDLPYGSSRRKKMISLFYGSMLRNGYTRSCTVASGMQVRFVQYREFCRAKGYKLNDLPVGWSKDETRAREMRDGLVLLLKDAWEGLPAEVREADEEGDGAKLKELSRRWWGPKFEVSLFLILATLHGIALTLHSPRDFLQDLGAVAARSSKRRQRQLAGLPESDDEDEADDGLEWTASPLFVIASSHAITVSKLVRSLLAPDGVYNGSVTTRAPPRIVKSLSVLWPVMALRAAWIHVLCIRKFHKIARQVRAGADADPLFPTLGTPAVSPEFLESLLDDVDACLRSIDDMMGGPAPSTTAIDGSVTVRANSEVQQPSLKTGRDPWRYARLVHGVMKRLLELDDGDGKKKSLELTEEEIEELSLVKDITN